MIRVFLIDIDLSMSLTTTALITPQVRHDTAFDQGTMINTIVGKNFLSIGLQNDIRNDVYKKE